ncbi:hypothetical protein BDB00DRAFT_783401 [Zychaea mexicana]|uniref:uncharacterized protein n=1 Tax=Zychaea mexicana TaxID=64656 RepID=UPI0022FE882F|nr:uncharacterized protein BDB00DRAFT_783401 [Zychaea mexicana]KAI9499334.1 hypothetical protein BDB00DRAFT_783401 [Zychaea mexicana]
MNSSSVSKLSNLSQSNRDTSEERIFATFIGFKDYFDAEKEDKPSLRGFSHFDLSFFCSCSPSDPSQFKAVWSKRFKTAVQQHNIRNYAKHQPDWRTIQALIDLRKESRVESPSDTPSKQSGTTVSSSFLDFVRNQHQTLKGPKWILSTGTCVEDKILEFAMKCQYEHACHAMIIDVNDPSWSEYFTGDELEEISNHNNPALPKVSEKVKNHLDLFRTFDASKNPNGKVRQPGNYLST